MADGGVAQTSAYLRMLLLRPGEYRRRWERHASQPQPGEIDIAAVARVLAEDASGDTATDLVATVRQALDGGVLDAEALRLFVDAFAFDGRDAIRLYDLLRGSDSVRVITGEAQSLSEEHLRDGPPRHQTLALHELHVLGPDGTPAEHQTIQVIQANVNGLAGYPYRFDTDELAVEVIRGGRVGDRIYRINESLYAVDILLTRPLEAGETTLTQVRTTFFYKTPPAPEFRRGVVRRTDDVTIWVKFHQRRVPARVWLARWDGIDHARIVDRQVVELDDDLAVHCRFGPIEQAVVGFHWEWA
ncbi:hypothetical protein HC028_20550 [Planosporangium flavigriseum]|uniref:Uncharacterized protein n=1 Tax=Planosporangium flavigriseum TaxID=373681 RepID=A0A8J3LJI8_9ACTN|nr:hypothetical protein [Planosporangium flavigriseum]NJC66878.1 hypothetical protein [Planosporangium flavigriseum]GIG74378.1 hypothetical protein Pfl04_27820 [Planosporangium flavigriseum]